MLVFVAPTNMTIGWYYELWEKFVAPSLGKLSLSPPPNGGWKNPQSRLLVEAALKQAIEGTSWQARFTSFPTWVPTDGA